MRCCKYLGILASALVVLALACGIDETTAEEPKSDLEHSKVCVDICGENEACVDGKCECKEGFFKNSFNFLVCERSVCSPECGKNGKCVNNKCICDEGYENFGEGGSVNCSKPVEHKATTCREDCGENEACVGGKCECTEGFFKKVETNVCERSVCSPECGKNEKCVNSKCICEEGYENFGEGGSVNCSKPVGHNEGKLQFSEILPPTSTPTTTTTTTTTTPTTTTTTTTTTPTTTTTTTTTTPTTTTPTTIKTTTTTTTTAKPTLKPTDKSGKSGLSIWAIALIIILVGSIVGLIGFKLFRPNRRGSYRTTSTSVN